jgi:hypothetical protein
MTLTRQCLLLGYLLVSSGLGCRAEPPKTDTDTPTGTDLDHEDDTAGADDLDGDGFTTIDDCDDADARVYPGAVEYCDGLDNDCDGTVDEDDAANASTWYADTDGDGYGDPGGATAVACEAPDGFAGTDTDCNDADAAFHPGAEETDCTDPDDYNCDGSVGYADVDGDGFVACRECDDSEVTVNPAATEICNGVDDDCEGTIDGPDAADATTWYTDGDADLYGDDATGVVSCEAPLGTVADGGDCDDTDPAYHPGATETCADAEDFNCDGSVLYADADADGWAACEECDDADAAVNPDATEACNGIDDDCDGSIDEDGADAWYADTDGDGFGDPGAVATGCTAPAGYVADATDCDDANAAAYPGAAEACTDAADLNCDGSIGYADADGDGFAACEECDDGDAAVNPAATELCNGIDDNCDGAIDEGGAWLWYADVDSDGFGDPAIAYTSCTTLSGYVNDATDCDDTDSAVYPGAFETCADAIDLNCDGSIGYSDADGDGWAACIECDDGDAAVNPDATEICDGIDNNCDGSVDEGGFTTWYADADGDGYGDPSTSATGCTAPTGYVADGTDCDDTDATFHPGATESCTDAVDYNCDGSVGLTDADGDGWAACEECDDGDATVNPDAVEVCDGVDDDCDGSVDEGGTTTWYRDVDGDTYGDPGATSTGCSAPAFYVADGTDCDDGDATVHPGATETCTDATDLNCDGSVLYTDADGDGYAACEECDDGDAAINPAATEICDGADNDCDGTIDEGGTSVWYADADADGYGDATATTVSCTAPAGYVANPDDCDDTETTIHPGATETCTDTVDLNCDGSIAYADADADGWAACEECDDTDATVNPDAIESCDGIDNDCDGTVDEAGTDLWYADADGDSFGDALASTTGCSAPSGYVGDATDCDDTDSAAYPGAPETCTDTVDRNCDGSVAYADGDADGWAACQECDDGDAGVNPDAIEVCDGIDNDCDGTVDEGGTTTWYRDADSDGYGDASASTTACTAPSGYVANATDCDDADRTAHPGSVEICDGADDDCDGTIDEGVTTTWYRDGDSDSYGDSARTTAACTAPASYVASDTDCDDTDATVHPGATEACTDTVDMNCDGSIAYADADADGWAACEECDDTDASVNPDADEVCDGVDNDCDGTVDGTGAIDVSFWYADDDTDGYGDASVATADCDAPAGYLADATDCDDTDAAVNPGEIETCNAVDDDCDGTVDDGVTTTWYTDVDRDSYGDLSSPTAACGASVGIVADSTDCDDTSATVHPRATETCNGIDDDCDGTVDDGVGSTWYADTDGDGFGDAAVTSSACTRPTGYVSNATDCDDGDATAYPGATEICDGVDDDCDGTVDDGVGSTWYADADSDGYGDAGVTSTSCSAPSGYVADDTDCNDASALYHPGATESCTVLVDLNCDGSVGGADADADGYAACVECDDADAAVNPGATERCNGLDDDCDGLTDDSSSVDATSFYADADSDSYGDSGVAETACSSSAGYVSDATDCDDARALTNPGASEYCNSIDDDCDGTVDDTPVDRTTWYVDADADSYGVTTGTTLACTRPSGYAALSTDCDDTASSVHPGATEVCNSIDDDCDGVADAGLTVTWYRDADTDTYGDPTVSTDSCTAPSGYVRDDTDCDDTNATIYEGAPEIDDLYDQDCDGWIDEDFVAAGDVMISEVHRRLGRGSPPRLTNGQWFEIYNGSSRTVALDNWHFYRYNPTDLSDYFYVDPADALLIEPNQYLVFCKGDDYDAANNPGNSTLVCDYFWGDDTQPSTTYQGTYHSNAFVFARSNDLLEMSIEGTQATGRVIDQVHWTYDRTNGYWPRDATQSMSLDDSSMDATLNDSLSYWCSTPATGTYVWYSVGRTTEYGTPGSANYDCP